MNFRRTTIEQSKQFTLGELILELSAISADEDCTVQYDFCGFVPTKGESWRGAYEEFAIGYTSEFPHDGWPKLAPFLEHLKSCVGRDFIGWKGGKYTMGESTPVWVSNRGETDHTVIVAVRSVIGANGCAYRVILCTEYCEF